MAFNIAYKFQVLDGFSGNLSKFTTKLKGITPVMRRAALSVSGGFKKMGEGIDRARGKMTGLSLGITAFGALAGRNILSFQKGMNLLEAASGATKEEMVDLRKTARDLGRVTEFTAGNAAFAMAELGKAGFTAKENIETIPAVLSLASAGSLGLAEAAGIVSGTLKGFGIDTKESGRVADVLAKAASSAKTTVGQMGFALSKVGPIAKTIGVDLETTSAILAIFQDQNIEASLAGTGLRGILAKLSKTTPEANKAFKAMGISTKQIGEFMKKGDIIGLFKKFSEAGLDAKKAAQIFGLETLTTALAFSSAADKVEKLTAGLRGAEGTAKRMAETQLQGLPGAIKIAQSAFESLQLQIGEAGLTKRLAQLANGVKTFSNNLEKMDPALLAAAVDLGFLFVGITAVLVPLGALSFAVSGLAALVGAISFVAVTASMSGMILPAIALLAAVERLTVKWDDLKKTFKDEGFLASVKEFFGLKDLFGLEALDRTTATTKRLESALRERGISFPNRAGGLDASREILSNRRDLQNRLAARGSSTDVNLNGSININTDSGAAVQSTELGISGANGNIGLNAAGAQ